MANTATARKQETAPFDPIKVLHASGVWGDTIHNQATIVLDVDGQHITKQATGNGPVSALFRAIAEAVPHTARLVAYSVKEDGDSPDASGTVSITLASERDRFVGVGNNRNTMVAAAYAYIDALNKLRCNER